MDQKSNPTLAANPLFNDNQLKLGIFGTNVSNACAPSLAEGGLEVGWDTTTRITDVADRAGFEALIPIARWKGVGGPTDWNGTSFETYTWAAGTAASTSHASVFSTSHVSYTHPIAAAKAATTIDHISGGRFALNVVGGGMATEQAMFGISTREHDDLYELAEEWITLVRRIWQAEEAFDFEGKFFNLEKVIAKPQPIQRPFPPVMNAGLSPRGQRFAAEHADMMFFILQAHELDKAKQQIDEVKTLARREHNRELQAWSHAYIVCRDTEEEARAHLDYYVNQKGDWEAVDELLRVVAPQVMKVPKEVLDRLRFHFVAGWGGYPLVGTPEQIVDELVKLSSIGVDGLLIHWHEFEAGLGQFTEQVLPLIEQAGLRKPFTPQSA